jgi:hypothetical protein
MLYCDHRVQALRAHLGRGYECGPAPEDTPRVSLTSTDACRAVNGDHECVSMMEVVLQVLFTSGMGAVSCGSVADRLLPSPSACPATVAARALLTSRYVHVSLYVRAYGSHFLGALLHGFVVAAAVRALTSA